MTTTTVAAPKIQCRNVRKTFELGKETFVALGDVSLDIADSEFVTVVGPSGCGKSTLMNILAGLDEPSSGEALVDGVPVRGPGPERGVIFQQYALFPWLTVRKNVEFGLEIAGLGKAERREIAEHYIELVGLEQFADALPKMLSGGMKQRCAIARAYAVNPSILLMDEPFGALDAQTRQVMQQELDRIWRTSGCTVIFVTHDIDEAIVLADRILVMTAGPEATIKSTYEVDIPRPRDEAGEAAIALHRKLREDIGAEVRKALQGQGLTQEGS